MYADLTKPPSGQLRECPPFPPAWLIAKTFSTVSYHHGWIALFRIYIRNIISDLRESVIVKDLVVRGHVLRRMT